MNDTSGRSFHRHVLGVFASDAVHSAKKFVVRRSPMNCSAFLAIEVMIFFWAPLALAQSSPKDGGGGGLEQSGDQGRRQVRPTPHWPDGRVNLGPGPGEKKGVWIGPIGPTLTAPAKINRENLADEALVPGETLNVNAGSTLGLSLPTNPRLADVPFQPWARALYEYRNHNLIADDPHVRCKPSGGPRPFHTPYGFELVDDHDDKRIYMFEVGGPHTWRVIYMDGRKHPKNFEPSYLGHSIGSWEGKTLVVDSVGYNERFWMTREGLPHTEKLHLVERFTRLNYDTLKYVAIIDDPGAYTKRWSGGWLIKWAEGEELYEYICQDNNQDPKHLFDGAR
jgi:hypothetical protein